MAPSSVFITGVTGYIGGDYLAALMEKHPDYDVTALVRTTDKGAQVASVYPTVKLVYGDLDSADVLEEQASKADIVLHFANADSKEGTASLIKGLQRSTKTEVFYIHTSGTGMLGVETVEKQVFGQELTKTYDDWENIDEMWKMPESAAHRPVDMIVQASWSDKLKTAIVCPPTIYGNGRGPGNQRSIQTPKTAEAILKNKKGVLIGEGKNIWHQVHVQDLSDLYLKLTEAAANGGAPATWNDQGYYFAENGSFVWGDIMKAIVKDAHSKGLLPSAEITNLSNDQVEEELFPHAEYYVGTNSRGVSKRGKQLLGWKPYRPSLLETIPALVDEEARSLGLTQGHAAKVAA